MSPVLRPFRARLLCEVLGTALLVGVGTGAMVLDASGALPLGGAGISVAFALVVVAAILLFGPISGAHINPAVTLGFAVAGRFPRHEISGYLAAQCVGAVLGSVVVALFLPEHPDLGSTLPAAGTWASLGIEVLATLGLVFVVLRITSLPLPLPAVALVIGATVGALAWTAGPFTGASMNPARSLGPALVSGQLGPLWIYFVAPTLGGLAAVPLCRALSPSHCCSGACTP
jgi:MIP family channel proteins